MSTADQPGREQILGAVREQLGRAPRNAAPSELPAVRSAGAIEPTADAFEARLTAVGGRVWRVADTAAAAQKIEEIAGRDGARIATSDAPLVEDVRRHLPDRLLLEPNATRDELLACDAGVTTAQWGVAETGSLVLVSSAERHRLVSLLPPVHFAVLPADRIVGTLAEALAAARGSVEPPGAITLVTGPSRTADIELTLVVGVHGPRELHVLLLAPA